MTILYAVCAAVGGTILVCQFLMTLLGLGHDHGADFGGDVGHDFGHGGDHVAGHGDTVTDGHDVQHHHHGPAWFFGVVTFRTMTAALTFFGLAGLAARSNGVQPLPAIVIALAAGAAAMYGVHWMMRTLYRLRASGNVRIDRAVGCRGTVYLTVPGNRGGVGKIHLNLQNRTMEYQATTAADALPTGATIVVVGVVNSDTVEVALAPEPEKVTHA
jgi:membrane protein implicated in regulation of membrane protease activity